MFTEQSRSADALWVHLVHEGICVLAQTGSVDDDFKVFFHLLQKVVNVRPLQNIDIGGAAIHFNGYYVIRILNYVKLRMN